MLVSVYLGELDRKVQCSKDSGASGEVCLGKEQIRHGGLSEKA